MIRKKRGLGSLAAVAVSGATILGGLFVTTGTAYAAATPLSTTSWTAVSSPNVYPGGTNQAAGNWKFTIHNTFTTGETYTVGIGPAAGPQCVSGTDYVGFAGVPTVSSPAPEVTNTGTADTAPKISVSTVENPADGAGCTAAGVKDELILTISNTATGTAGDNYDLVVSGVSYNVGPATPAAAGGTLISTSGSDEGGLTGETPTTFTVGSNARMQPLSIKSNTPPVGIVPGTSAAISNIVLTEALPNTVNASPVTLTLPSGDNITSTVTVTVTGGNATVCNSGTCTAGASSTTVAPASTPTNSVSFYVKTASTVASTFTVSGITVAVGGGAGPENVTVVYDTASDQIQNTAFAVINYSRTAGFTADDTAAASFQKAYPFSDDLTTYSTVGDACSEDGGLGTIVLVADFTPYDALSANYLAQWAGTGVVITPYNSLSSAAANIIRNYAIGTVYIVGGTAAVSQAVQTQLAGTQAYCENGTPDTNTAGAVHLNVVRIAGTTAAETSSDVAQFPGANAVGTMEATPGAYSGTTGAWNDTTGKSSASGPGTGCCYTTAIVATDFTFQDSLGAGPLSYGDSLPVILTDQGGLSNSAAAALVNLGIQQVYLLGGPGAISDAVVTSIQNLGISVLRIAGLTFGDTSQQLARFEMNNQNAATPTATEGLDNFPSAIGSARGDDYTDALTSAAALVKNIGECDCDFNPLVLTTNTSTVGSDVDTFLKAAGSAAGIGSNGVHTFGIQVFGGTLAQTPALVQQELNDIANG